MNSKSKLALGILLVTAAIFAMLIRIADHVALIAYGATRVNDDVAGILATIIFLAGALFLVGSTNRKGD